jgi:hypothetical protein
MNVMMLTKYQVTDVILYVELKEGGVAMVAPLLTQIFAHQYVEIGEYSTMNIVMTVIPWVEMVVTPPASLNQVCNAQEVIICGEITVLRSAVMVV